MKIVRYFTFILISSFMFLACRYDADTRKVTDNREEVEIAGKPIYLSKNDFLSKVYDFRANPNEWTYLGDKPAIIDFYADWCPPCKAIAPTLDKLAKKYNNQIYIYKVDVDKERELAQHFGIASIPTLLFVPTEGKPEIVSGALPEAEFEKNINDILLKK
jgi:thioredoxin